MVEIRRANDDELSRLLRIQLMALGLEEMLDSFAPGEVPALYRHGQDNGETLVALEDGVPVGFSVGYHRDGTWFLGEFFVLPETQSSGIGRALLERAKPAHQHCSTVSTSDLRAQALYARSGMTPLWPSFQLRGEKGRIRVESSDGYEVAVTALGPTMRAWDTAVSGRNRPEDLEFLLQGWNGLYLWVECAGRLAGYAGVARRGNGRVTIGPVGVRDTSDAKSVMLAVVSWVFSQDEISSVTIDVPGPHPALPALLGSGFRIADQNIFCSSDPSRFGDPRTYVPLTPAIY